MKKLRIGIGQLNSRDDIEKNFKNIENQIREMVSQGARLVAFPEYATYLSQRGSKAIAEPMTGSIVKRFKDLAKKYAVTIHNGSFIEKETDALTQESQYFNTSLLISSEGEVLAKYRKIHLFDVDVEEGSSFRESDTFSGGNEIVTYDYEQFTLGFSICYDLRFPDLYRALTRQGAKIIFVPAAFTLFTGKDHWEALLRARAIENQAYIVAPAQFGERPIHKMSFGNSMLIDPWGTVIQRASDRVCTLVVEIDLDYLEHVREHLPSLKNEVDINTLISSQGLKHKI